MSQKKKFKAAFSQRSSSTDGSSTVVIGNAYCAPLVYFESIKLWRVHDANCLALEPGETPLNPQMIDWLLTGVSRIDSYINHYFINNVSEDGPLMQQIQPTVEKRDTTNKNFIERGVSTTERFAEDNYLGDELKKEFKSAKADWNTEWGDLPYKPLSTKKSELARALCKIREVLISRWNSVGNSATREIFWRIEWRTRYSISRCLGCGC
jgi:hypothetical protein